MESYDQKWTPVLQNLTLLSSPLSDTVNLKAVIQENVFLQKLIFLQKLK